MQFLKPIRLHCCYQTQAKTKNKITNIVFSVLCIYFNKFMIEKNYANFTPYEIVAFNSFG